MTRIEIIEYVESKRRVWRSIGNLLANGAFWEKQDIIQLLKSPERLQSHLKGIPRKRLLVLAKKYKIKNYGRMNVVTLAEAIDEKRNKSDNSK
jgi:hypothetical protein